MGRSASQAAARLTGVGLVVAIAGLLLMHGFEATTAHLGHASPIGHVAEAAANPAETHTMAGACALLLAMAVGFGKPDLLLSPRPLSVVAAAGFQAKRRPHGRALLDILCILRV